MTRHDMLTALILYLQKEMPVYAGYLVPSDDGEAFNLFRALCNVRPPRNASGEFLRMQDDLLKSVTEEKGITDGETLSPCGEDDRLSVWQGDITTLKCEAIVNAANSQMLGCFRPLHGCIDNIIHTMAGVQLRCECARQMKELKAVYGADYEQPAAVPLITPGYNLPAKYVIHVVGPIVSPYLKQKHKDLLAECYRSCLDLAAGKGCRNIAFCCISTGVYMFPQEKAAEIAVYTVRKWLDEHTESCMKKVIFNVFKDSDLRIYQRLLESVDSSRLQ